MKKKVRVGVALWLAVVVFLLGFVANTEKLYAASANGTNIVEMARRYIGRVPYVWGGTNIDGENPGADCSGFICRIYEKFGFDLWANRTQLRNCGTNLGTDLSCAQLGDIIWFEGHVAIYSGVNSNGQHMIVHETGGKYQNVVETPASWVGAELKGVIRIPGVVKEGFNHPQGNVDAVTSEKGAITVTGWAFDRDDLNAQLDIHVYVGGAAGSGAPCYVIKADKKRTDVNDVYPGAGNYHGFHDTIKVPARGETDVYVYAINNVINQNNPLLGKKTVNITNEFSIDFKSDALSVNAGESDVMNINFTGDGIASMNYSIEDTDVCSASWGSTNWTHGTTSLTISGKKAGSTNVTLMLLNSAKETLYQKSFKVSVSAVTGKITISPNKLILNTTKNKTGVMTLDFSSCKNGCQIYRDYTNEGIITEEGFEFEVGYIAKVSYTAKKTGETQVVYEFVDKYGNNVGTATAEIVVQQLVTGIDLNKAITLNRGEVKLLGATVVPSDATDKRISWISSDTSVATVDSQGRVTAVGTGTATITATAADGSGVKATCTVTVVSNLSITAQPANVSITEGGNATFKVTASGANLTYQWQFKNASATYWTDSTMTGSNTNSITVKATTARNGYQYRCVVKDGSGNKVTSNAAKLTVNKGAQITGQPSSATVTEGGNATFKVTATGSGLTYQWQFKKAGTTYWTNSTMTGSKTNSITVQGTTARNGYQYRCVVKDANGNKVTSNAATLTVVQGQGVKITGQPGSQIVTEGSNATFKVTATGSNLTYQWQFKKAGTTYWSDSTMAGSKTNSITVQGTTARNGYQYRCVVKDGNGNKVTSNAATLTVVQGQGVKITSQPASQSVTAGSSATFKVTASGSGLTYQWQFKSTANNYWADSTMAGSKTNSITVQGTAARNGYEYRCVVKDSNGNKVTSNAAKLTVQ